MLSLPEPAVALTAVSRVHRTAAGEVGAVAGVTLRVDADDSETEAMRQAILRYQATTPMRSTSTSTKAAGIVLIVLTGLFNFHLPHFVIERAAQDNLPTYMLEIALLALVVATTVAAVAIFRNRRWGWRLGLLVAGISVVLYLVQETIGLPGLQKTWLEPSRLLSLALEGLFVVLAVFRLVAQPRRTGG